MRKIEKLMVEAVNSGRNWGKDNTQVVITKGNPWPSKGIEVYLHGHQIAQVCRETGVVFPNMNTLKAWPTATTKSRLRALGVNLTQNKGNIYIDGCFVCSAL